MLKKAFSIVLCAVIACAALFCVAYTVSTFKTSFASNSDNGKDSQVCAYDIAPSVSFDSVNEYIAYVTAQNESSSPTQTTSSSAGGYYTPENIPEGFVVESVVIDSTGTSFFIVPADGNYVTSNDPASVALYNTSIRRVYDQYPLVNYITDQPAYAARLASDIGATPTGNQINGHPTYLGNVEVYVPEMNSSSNIVVGSQFIFINNRGLAEYLYSPLGIDFANRSIGNGLADSITLEFHAFNTAHSDVIE